MEGPVLVIGTAGFLGRHFTRHFHLGGHPVVGVDSAPPENAPLALLQRYAQMTLPDPAFGPVLNEVRPALVIHAAGRAAPSLSVADPSPDYYAGPVLQFEILEALRRHAPDCRYVFLSSAAVYGNPQSLPVGEDQPPAPISPYGYHKWQGELLCSEFSRVYGLRTASVRIFSAYGPGLRRQVIWDLCQKTLSSEGPLHLQGTGQESRDFIHAQDIARGVERVALSAVMKGEVYNLSSGEEIRIADLAALILDALGLDRRLQFDEQRPPGTPVNWRADISRLVGLGFRPQIPIREGIRTVARWCKAELGETL